MNIVAINTCEYFIHSLSFIICTCSKHLLHQPQARSYVVIRN